MPLPKKKGLKIRKCNQCGEEFETTHPLKATCSPKCSHNWTLDHWKRRRAKKELNKKNNG
jgi:hypothetical protein